MSETHPSIAHTRNCPRHDKRAYSTRKRALSAAHKKQNSTGRQLFVYKCQCGAFHLTSQPQGLKGKQKVNSMNHHASMVAQAIKDSKQRQATIVSASLKKACT